MKTILLVALVTTLYSRLGGTTPVSANTNNSSQVNLHTPVYTRSLDGRDGREGPPGPRGLPGRDGRDGLTGPPGPNTNIPGPQGTQGERGSSGPAGSPGPRGESAGVTSHQGERGIPGIPGPQGEPGSLGEQGIQGDRGIPGPVGPQGEHGTGSPGEQGERGIPGPVGPQGVTGTGSPGEQGERGIPGPVGPQGEHGTGEQGEMGSTGEPGTIGNQGRRGIRGLTGPTGSQGGQGLSGNQGEQGTQGPPGTAGKGVVYTRWGSSSCPSVPGTSLVYAGRAGGSYYTHDGGGANHLCMPSDPQYTLPYRSGARNQAYVYGSEYQDPLQGTNQHNVPCVVCLAATRGTVLMLPAKTSCPTSWTTEYTGYLMTEHHAHKRSMYECVDRSQESIPGTEADTNGALFYHVEVNCNGLQCPPYDAQKELTCAVCTI